ncbi:MAG: hypothetical protein KGJ78_02375 [Alphaproteobacteria bacterium]|nr:hypothetical protein [Alphaproteobacteria bacterium]
MTLLIALGIWVLVSAAFTPLIGYFLSEAAQRAEDSGAIAHYGAVEMLEARRGMEPRA